MTPQIIDGPLSEVREQLNALRDTGQEAHVVLYAKAADAPHLSPWDFDPYGKPYPTRAETLAYIKERMKNPLTDPEEIRNADEEFEEFQRNLNQNRIDAGESPLFSE